LPIRAAMAAEARLMEERKSWRKDRPPLFVAKPMTRSDGSQSVLEWDIRIPARKSSIWWPGLFPATMSFPPSYPESPPRVKFLPITGKPLFHPNVYLDGGVCMSIINPPESVHGYGRGGTWSPSITMKQVLLALQTFLDESDGLAQGRDEPYRLRKNNYQEYIRRVKEQVSQVEQLE